MYAEETHRYSATDAENYHSGSGTGDERENPRLMAHLGSEASVLHACASLCVLVSILGGDRPAHKKPLAKTIGPDERLACMNSVIRGATSR
jgi:hypothetical protein